MKKLISLSVVSLLVVVTSGCAIRVKANGNHDAQDYSSVFGGVKIDRGSKARDISSVNGGIEVESNSFVRNIETVNGGIDIGNNVSIRMAETVNGGIETGKSLKVEKSLETVNGGIWVGSESHVGNNVTTVNGDIELNNVIVDRNIKTHNGDVILNSGSIVKGDIIIEESSGWFSSWFTSQDTPLIKIGDGVQVHGKIHLYKKAKLKISNKAKIGDVVRHFKQE